jgi:pterin-4a-carbinolamine dehydratase
MNSISKKLVEKLDKIYADLAKSKDFGLIGFSILATGPAIKTYEFDDFNSAVYFVSEISKLVEKFDTVPEIRIVNKKVIIEIYNRQLQTLTEDDLHLAIAIEDLYATLTAAKEYE